MSRRKRLLFCLPFSPRLDAHDEELETAEAVAQLALRHEVVVLSLRRPDEPAIDDVVRQRCAFIDEVLRPVERGRRPSRSAAGSDEYRSRLRELAAEWAPDVVHLETEEMLRYAPALARCRAVRVLTVGGSFGRADRTGIVDHVVDASCGGGGARVAAYDSIYSTVAGQTAEPLAPAIVAPPAPRGLKRGATPTFTVVVPAYQAAETIRTALDSVFTQTVPAHEVIVCDDGSTDAIEEAVVPYRDRIVFLRKKNGGAASARNAAMRAATGDFLAFLDADDAYLPRRLEVLGELASRRPDLDILTTDVYLELDGRLVTRLNRLDHFPAFQLRRTMLKRNVVLAPAVRRERLLRISGFDESRAIAIAEDWDCWLRLVLDGARTGFVDEALYRYRLQSGSQTNNREKTLRAIIVLLTKATMHPAVTVAERKVLDRSLAFHRALLAREAPPPVEQRGERLRLLTGDLWRGPCRSALLRETVMAAGRKLSGRVAAADTRRLALERARVLEPWLGSSET